ncbi:antibiotic biosynthesis monooxygenase family protein [Paraburkholderia sp. HD33-4]|uniref:antibiotic biosynthesis monooxygenase family protein n=1 Tax=Paraburkholderia sp. HD33-4 TaxID=2883242 RepID=UPI001F1FE983|nr:antibiotic biosynthesis monooxygenase [Paraburkholderia sp. HD33-4]
MIVELVDIKIKASDQEGFQRAISHGLRHILSNAPGFLSYEISHCIESPERYALRVCWESVEHHTLGFRHSPDYAEWQTLVSPFFAQRPLVEHFEIIASC